MKRFLIQIAVFFAFVAVIDVCCGFGFDYLRSHAKGGETYKNYYIAEKCEDDVLILGSSRAARHYVPQVIEDSLGLTCYNAGEPGCGIIPAYAYYKMVAERHKPKLVIYEVTPEYDYYVSDDYSKYLGRIRQYYDLEPVKELYKAFGDEFDVFKLSSNLYRNNSSILSNVEDLFSESNNDGFEPLYGEIDGEIKDGDTKQRNFVVDSLKLSYFENLLQLVKQDGTQMILCCSPRYNITSSEETNTDLNEVLHLANIYDADVIDCTSLEGLTKNNDMFHDISHLNEKGAIIFSSYLSRIIKDRYERTDRN